MVPCNIPGTKLEKYGFAGMTDGQKNCPDGHVQRVNGLMNNWKCECYLLKLECYPLEAYAWTKIVNIFINKMESETEYTLS